MQEAKQYIDKYAWWHGRKRVEKFRDDLPVHTVRVTSLQLRSETFPFHLLEATFEVPSVENVKRLRQSQLLTVRDLDPIRGSGGKEMWRFTFQIIWPEEKE